MSQERVPITVDLGIDLHTAIAERAAKESITVEAFVVRLLHDFLRGAVKRMPLAEEVDYDCSRLPRTSKMDK